MTIISDDKTFLETKFANPLDDSEECLQFSKFICLHLFRICDVPSKILEYSFLWYYVSGYALSITVAIDVIVAFVCFHRSNNTDALLSVIALPFSFGSQEHKPLLMQFWLYAFIRFIAVNVFIWYSIFSNNSEDVFSIPLSFDMVLWTFGFAGASLKFCFATILYSVLGVGKYCVYSKERGNVETLLRGKYFSDAIELIFYKNFNLKENATKIYTSDENQYTLLSVAVKARLTKLVESLWNSSLFSIINYCKEHEDGLPALNELLQTVDEMFMSKEKKADFLNNVDHVQKRTCLHVAMSSKMTFNSIDLWSVLYGHYPDMYKQEALVKEDKYSRTVLYYAIKYNHEHVVLAYLKSINDTSRKHVLKKTDAIGQATAFHVAIIEKSSFRVFRILYQYCPPDDRNELLEQEDKKNRNVFDYCNEKQKNAIHKFILLRFDKFQCGDGIFIDGPFDNTVTDIKHAIKCANGQWFSVYHHLSIDPVMTGSISFMLKIEKLYPASSIWMGFVTQYSSYVTDGNCYQDYDTDTYDYANEYNEISTRKYAYGIALNGKEFGNKGINNLRIREGDLIKLTLDLTKGSIAISINDSEPIILFSNIKMGEDGAQTLYKLGISLGGNSSYNSLTLMSVLNNLHRYNE